jgi:hypothetical protein
LRLNARAREGAPGEKSQKSQAYACARAGMCAKGAEESAGEGGAEIRHGGATITFGAL